MKRNISTLVPVLAVVLLVGRSGFGADTSQTPLILNVAAVEINWKVISSGGSDAAADNLRISGTVGQTAIGHGSSTDFGINHGFWQDLAEVGCCDLDGIRGDCEYDGNLNIADLTFMVDYLFRSGAIPQCPVECDDDCDGNINVADLTYVVDFLFRGGPPPCRCDCSNCTR